MASHDLNLDQSQNMSPMPVSQLELDHNHAHDSAHNYEQFLTYRQDNNEGRVESQNHTHENALDSQLQLLEHAQNVMQNGDSLDAGDDHAQDHANEAFELDLSCDLQLDIDQDNHDGLDDNLEFSFDENLGIDDGNNLPALDLNLFVEEPMDFFDTGPLVLQSRTLDPPHNHKFTVGQQFPDAQSCRRALREAAIALRFEMRTIKSDKARYTAQCASQGCPWRIHAAKLPNAPTFTIRTIHEQHTCAGLTHIGHHQASVQWIANCVEQKLRRNPDFKPKEILEEIHQSHGITLSYKQAWRGKERMMATFRGSFEQDFRLLPQYCDQIKMSNPGSVALVYGNPDDDNCFKRLFISFQASIYGFLNACRPLIGLDCVTLRSKHLGSLLLASSFDGDGGLYPLAFGVVNEEVDENWAWFLSELHSLLETNAEYMPRLTILSNQKQCVVDGVDVTFPSAYHGLCLHCLSESFAKEFRNTFLTEMLWEAAHSLTAIEFETKILEMNEISPEAANWIRRVPPRLWATAYFEGTRLGQLTANIDESLYNVIVEASGLPIIQMMESIRRHLMTMFNERRQTGMAWASTLVPYAEKQVCEAIEKAHNCKVLRKSEAEAEVLYQGSEIHIVNIRSRCCSCRGWQKYGLPCSHSAAVLLSCGQNVHGFTESCFTVATYRKTYSTTIHPILDKAMWNTVNEGGGGGGVEAVVINPPKSLKPPAKPRKRRDPAEDSGGRQRRVVHCGRCKQTGHFRTTCSVPI